MFFSLTERSVKIISEDLNSQEYSRKRFETPQKKKKAAGKRLSSFVQKESLG